jgi:hypothetical protein
LISETCVKKQGSQWSPTHRRIGASGIKSLVHEIAIGEFPRESGSLITVGIRGVRSRGVGVWYFGFSHTKEPQQEKPRFRDTRLSVEETVIWRIEVTRASGFGISGYLVTGESWRNRETLKRDGPTVIASKWRIGGIADRESEIHEVSDL